MRIAPLTSALCALLFLAACSESSQPPLPPLATRSADPAPPATSTPPPESSGDPRTLRIALEPVAGGLASPLLATHAGDGSGRLFVVEQEGRIQVLEDGQRAATPFLDIADRIAAGGEQGLLGLAFHPRFAGNGRFFVNYTDREGDTVIAEYLVEPPDADAADASTERVLLRIPQPFANHNGGHLAFGPDGLLYVATGDGGSAGDPEENAQDAGSLLGKLLRIDVDAQRPYAAPPDNPFVGQSGARPEVWALGLRNPWRFSFDRANGDLWVGDVGQGDWEEIDRVGPDDAGVNFGWDVLEGEECFEPPNGCDSEGLEPPVAVYARDGGSCSVTGGYVYRGPAFRGMHGIYFFGDYCSGKISALAAERPQEIVELMDTELSISSFGEDEEGELYVTDLGGGTVLRVVEDGG